MLIKFVISLNKIINGSDIVWLSDLNYHIFFRYYSSVFSLVLDSVSKQLEVHRKYSDASRFFNSLLGIWECPQKPSFVFDIFHQFRITYINTYINFISSRI